MAHRFIVGESPHDARGVLRALWRDGVGASVDLLGEATVTAAEADRYAQRCAAALDELGARLRAARPAPAARRDSAGPDPAREPVGQGLGADAAAAPRRPRARPRDAAERLRPLLRRARELGAHLHIDMECFDSREAVTRPRARAARRGRVRATGRPPASSLQAYLRDSPELLERIVAWARATARSHAADGAARQGRLLGPRGRRGAPARLEPRRCSRSRPTATATSRR